jgi:uncharacterized protein (TIGR02996 family)
LRAICESPADDAPRLIYADWLDENGDAERAEFIRLQVGLVHGYDAEEALAARFRCEELFRANGLRWANQLPGTIALWAETRDNGDWFEAVEVAGPEIISVVCQSSLEDWERGFPATVYIQGDGHLFLSRKRQIEEFVPVHRLRFVHLDGANGLLTALAKMTLLEKFRELIIARDIVLRDETAIALVNSPYISELRQLSLVAEQMSDQAGLAFTNSRFLERIEMLHLLRNHFGEPVRAALRARFGFRVYC